MSSKISCISTLSKKKLVLVEISHRTKKLQARQYLSQMHFRKGGFTKIAGPVTCLDRFDAIFLHNSNFKIKPSKNILTSFNFTNFGSNRKLKTKVYPYISRLINWINFTKLLYCYILDILKSMLYKSYEISTVQNCSL